MASAFTHGCTGAALGAVYSLAYHSMPTRFWILSVVLAILPDADALGFSLGVPYGSVFGHRGFTHSLLFAFIIALLTVAVAFHSIPAFSREWLALVGYFFLVVVSHPVLDAMTTGGLGVALLSPFDLTRYFFPWRPIQVSPIGVKAFFSSWGLRVIISEILWVWLPLLGLVAFAWLYRFLRSPQTPPS